jgi:peptide deformylase
MRVIKYGNVILATKTFPIVDFSTLPSIVVEMYKTLKNKGGVGLAAPQVGINQSFFITCIKDVPKLFVNPEIIKTSMRESKYQEGCLSLPELYLDIIRASEVQLLYWDIEGKRHLDDFKELEARVIQHEYDHLQGKLFYTRFHDPEAALSLYLKEQRKKRK